MRNDRLTQVHIAKNIVVRAWVRSVFSYLVLMNNKRGEA